MGKHDRHLVYVYGTLKKYEPNHGILQFDHSLFLGNSKDAKGIMFHRGPFPAVTLEEPLCEIQGEVYEVSNKTLESLDQLEGVPHHYLREKVRTHWGDANIYTFAKSKLREGDWAIPSGNWIGRTTSKIQWLGWGKGFAIGSPTKVFWDPPPEARDTPWRLRQLADGLMECVNTETGEVYGTFKLLGDYYNKIRDYPVRTTGKEITVVGIADRKPHYGREPVIETEELKTTNDVGFKIKEAKGRKKNAKTANRQV